MENKNLIDGLMSPELNGGVTHLLAALLISKSEKFIVKKFGEDEKKEIYAEILKKRPILPAPLHKATQYGEQIKTKDDFVNVYEKEFDSFGLPVASLLPTTMSLIDYGLIEKSDKTAKIIEGAIDSLKGVKRSEKRDMELVRCLELGLDAETIKNNLKAIK